LEAASIRFLTWVARLKKTVGSRAEPAGGIRRGRGAHLAAGNAPRGRRQTPGGLRNSPGTSVRREQREKAARLADPGLTGLVSRWGDDRELVRYGRELEVTADA